MVMTLMPNSGKYICAILIEPDFIEEGSWKASFD